MEEQNSLHQRFVISFFSVLINVASHVLALASVRLFRLSAVLIDDVKERELPALNNRSNFDLIVLDMQNKRIRMYQDARLGKFLTTILRCQAQLI